MPAARLSSAASFEFTASERESPEAPDSCEGSAAAAGGQIFYGWLMVALTTLVLVASSPGQTYGFTYFNPWLRSALHLSQTELSTTYLFATLMAAVPLSYAGGLVDRLGLKRSMLAAVIAMAAACVLAATVQNVPMLFGACVTLRLFGPGVMTLLSNNTLAAWFDRELGLASSAVQLAMAAAVALVPIGLMSLIAAVGWREAYALQAAALVVGVLPLVWLAYREDPGEIGQVRDGWAGNGREQGARSLRVTATVPSDDCAFDLAQAMATRTFWILMLATSMWSMIGTGLVFHLDSLLTARGLPTSEAAWATPVMATCMAFMQIVGGRLADRAAPGRLLAVALALEAGACVMLATARGSELVAAYGVFGTAQGLMSLVSTTVWARFFGRLHLGRIRGTALSAGISSSAVGPVVMGASFDYLGGFAPSLWAFACGALVVAAISPWATRPAVANDAADELTLPAAA